jgi:hypothetical protein
MNLKLHRPAVFCALLGGFLSLASTLRASPFLYTEDTDLMLCFRKIQRNGGTLGPNDYEINIGHASVYYGLTPGSTMTVTQFTANQLNSVFDDLNNVSWSVAGASPDGDGTKPAATIWITKKRSSLNVQSSPPPRKSLGFQINALNTINGIGDGAAFYSNGQPPDGTNNTATSVTIPDGNSFAYSAYVNASGIYSGYWGGDAEDSTPSDFTSGSNPSRIDLYELQVGSGPGTFLGYFDFKPDGTVTFTAAGGVTAPTINSITRTGTTNVLTFPSALSTVYNLRFTNSTGLSAPASTWPVILNVVSGNGSAKTITNVTTDPSRFYRLEAHP